MRVRNGCLCAIQEAIEFKLGGWNSEGTAAVRVNARGFHAGTLPSVAFGHRQRMSEFVLCEVEGCGEVDVEGDVWTARPLRVNRGWCWGPPDDEAALSFLESLAKERLPQELSEALSDREMAEKFNRWVVAYLDAREPQRLFPTLRATRSAHGVLRTKMPRARWWSGHASRGSGKSHSSRRRENRKPGAASWL